MIYVIFVILRKLLIIRRNEPACSSNQNCTVRVCEGVFQSLGFFPFFVPSSLVKKVKSKNPPCLVSFGSFLVVYWFYWQVHHFGSKIWLSQKIQPCAGHMSSTWPRWLPRKGPSCKFQILKILVKYNLSAFLVQSALEVSRSQSRTSFVQGVNRLPKALFLPHWKGQRHNLKCKWREIVAWRFLYFWFQCKVNGKIGICPQVSSQQ